MSRTAPPATVSEWRAHWPLVLASMIGISQIAVAIYTLGVLMGPLTHDFGWSRAEVSSGITILSLVAIPAGPIVGALIDRFGPRRLALPGILLQGLAFAAFALLSGAITQWWVIWFCYAVATQLVNTSVWSAAVTSVFHASRGMALAVMMCGTTIGSALAPVLAQHLIAAHGWRIAMIVIGLGWAAAMLLVTVPFFISPKDRRLPVAGSAASTAVDLPGLSLREAFRNSALLRIGVMVALLGGLSGSLIVHLVPILIASGFSRATAAGAMPLVAAAGLVGKLVTGWLLDHVPVRLVAGPTLALMLVPCLGFWLGGGSTVILLGSVAAVGWAMSSYLQSSAYLTSRYAGPRSFGLIFGIMMSVSAVGTAIGPILAGHAYDLRGNYDLLFIAGILMAAIAGLLMATLPRYPDWTTASRPAA